MDADNPFDRKLDANKRMPEAARAGLVDTIDTLDFVWAGVRAVFGSKATPAHAVALMPVVMAEIAEQRRQQQSE